jgi:hypothetical protein
MRLTAAALILQGTLAFHHPGNGGVSNKSLLVPGLSCDRRKCNRRPKPTRPIPFLSTSSNTIRAKSATTSLQAANPDDVVPIIKFFGSFLILVGGAVLFGMGSKVDERKRETLERQEYKRYLQRQAYEATKPKKVYPKGPKQIEAERKWAEVEKAARSQAEAAQREAEQVAMRLAAEKVAREQAEEEQQMEAEATRRRMVELEAATSVLEEPTPSQRPVLASPLPVVVEQPSKPLYLDAKYLDEVCEAPPAASDVQPTISTSSSAGSGTNYLDAIAEVCEAPDGTTTPSEACAGAISNYLDALSLSAAQPIDAGPGIANYLDSIANSGADASSASKASQGKAFGAEISAYGSDENEEDEVLPSTTPAVADYLFAMSSGGISPPSATSVKSFLNEVAAGALPGSGAAIAGYLASLDAASTAASRATGRGVPTYLDTVAATSGPSVAAGGGGGRSGPASYLSDISSTGSSTAAEAIEPTEEATTSAAPPNNVESEIIATDADSFLSTGSSYLDAISEACDGDQSTEVCAPAISNYLDALSTGVTQPSRVASAGISSYLDSVGGGVSVSKGGSGAISYLDALDNEKSPDPSAGGTDTEATISNYLEDVSSGNIAPPSASEVKSYLDELQSANTPRATGSGVPSYLDSVVASNGSRSVSTGGGSGPTNYLDSIGASVSR